MEQRNANGRFNRGSHLVHRIRAEDQEVSAGGFKGSRSVSEQCTCGFPIPAMLQPFNLVKVNAVKHNFRRVKPAQAFPDRLVDLTVVRNR